MMEKIILQGGTIVFYKYKIGLHIVTSDGNR
jgi:hypothetical protein